MCVCDFRELLDQTEKANLIKMRDDYNTFQIAEETALHTSYERREIAMKEGAVKAERLIVNNASAAQQVLEAERDAKEAAETLNLLEKSQKGGKRGGGSPGGRGRAAARGKKG